MSNLSFSSEQIANLQALYASGATSVTIDGQTINLDRDDIQRIFAQASRSDLTAMANNESLQTRVQVAMVDFNG